MRHLLSFVILCCIAAPTAAGDGARLNVAVLSTAVSEEASDRAIATAASIDAIVLDRLSRAPDLRLIDRGSIEQVLDERAIDFVKGADAAPLMGATVLIVSRLDPDQRRLAIEAVAVQPGQCVSAVYVDVGSVAPDALESHLARPLDGLIKGLRPGIEKLNRPPVLAVHGELKWASVQKGGLGRFPTYRRHL